MKTAFIQYHTSDAVCLSVGDNITELKRLSSNPRIITCKPSCFQAATTSQEILYLGETTRIISFQAQHLHLKQCTALVLTIFAAISDIKRTNKIFRQSLSKFALCNISSLDVVLERK